VYFRGSELRSGEGVQFEGVGLLIDCARKYRF